MSVEVLNEIVKVGIVIIVFFGVLVYLRHYYAKKCRNNILCEFVTDEGTGYKEFHPVMDGVLTVNPTKKRAGAEYAIGKMCTYIVDYPDGVPAFMSFIQSKAQKVVLDESTAEPLTNRTPLLLLTPQRIFNRGREKFTGLAAGQSEREERERVDRSKSLPSKGLHWSWIALFVIAGLAIAGIMIYNNYAAEISNAALGIGGG